MKKIGLFAKTNVPEALTIAREFLSFAATKKLEVFLEDRLARRINAPQGYPGEDIAGIVDLIIVLGGDGTLLSVIQMSKNRLVPILGVNLGDLGFLTEVHKEEFYQVVDDVLKGNYIAENRVMINVRLLRDEKVVLDEMALNDAVIRGSLARIITVDVFVDDEYLNRFKADGIIIATPTGSTAYSLSAGGPILHPSLPGLLVTPICPHILTNRPIVIPGDSAVRVVLEKSPDDTQLNIDGQRWESMREGDRVEISSSDRRVLLIRHKRRSYYEILRSKLSWGLR
jgi:NAD+ kinase